MSCFAAVHRAIALFCAYSVITAKPLLGPGFVFVWLLGLVLHITTAFCLGAWRVDRGWRRRRRAGLVAEHARRRRNRRRIRRGMRRVRRLLRLLKQLDKRFADFPESNSSFWNSVCQWTWSFVCDAPKLAARVFRDMAQSLSSYWLWLRRSLVSWARAVPMLSATLLGSLLFAGPMLAVTLFGGMLVLLVETLDAMSRLLHKSIVRWCTVTNEEAQASPRIDDSWNIGFESCYGEMQVPAFIKDRRNCTFGGGQDEEREFTATIEHCQCSTDPGNRTQVAQLAERWRDQLRHSAPP